MLLGNYSQLNSNVGRNIGGFTNPYGWLKYGSIQNFYAGDSEVAGITDKSSFNNGYLPPYSWAVAPKSGGLGMAITGSSSFNVDLIPQYLAIVEFTGSGDMSCVINGLGNLVCDLIGSSGFVVSISSTGNIEISFAGQGDLVASISADGLLSIDMEGMGDLSSGLSLFLNMVSAMTGSGTLSADASLVVGMLCAMSGGGTLSLDITGQKGMGLSLTGTGDLAADVNAFAEMVVSLIGSGILNAGVGAIAEMSIDMVVTGTGLTTSNVGAAVWASLLSDNNNPGSMGEVMNNLGSVADPWGVALPGSYASGEAGNILAKINELVDELHKLQGLDSLNPMTVTPTTREVGAIVLDITGDGVTSTTVTRQ